jgi:hypothetical protein
MSDVTLLRLNFASDKLQINKFMMNDEPLHSDEEIRLVIKGIVEGFPMAYRFRIKNLFPTIYSKIIDTEMSFAESVYLFMTNTTRGDYRCKNCGNLPSFWTATRGYMTYCSVKCRNIHCSTVVSSSTTAEFPTVDTVKKAIGIKYNIIPMILRREFPNLFTHLKSSYSSGSISERLYRWIYPKEYSCVECAKSTRFLDFRRGFQTYCGNKCMANSTTIKKKKESTLLETTGFRTPMHNPKSKSLQKKNAFSSKEYILPSGNKIHVQGYEGMVLDALFKSGMKETEILLHEEDMPEIFWADETGKTHRYFPDMYLPKMNLIIEVKSMHTWHGYESERKSTLGGKQINLLKRQACIDAGFNFKFIIR